MKENRNSFNLNLEEIISLNVVPDYVDLLDFDWRLSLYGNNLATHTFYVPSSKLYLLGFKVVK